MPISAEEINHRNREFYLHQSELLNRRICDPSLYGVAQRNMNSEASRNIPLRLRRSLEELLADAEEQKTWFQSSFARKGGAAPKSNALNDVIQGLVHRDPSISQEQLLEQLEREVGEGTIVSIEEESQTLADEGRRIHYEDDDGRQKVAAVSGLKDRLARVKKKLRHYSQ